MVSHPEVEITLLVNDRAQHTTIEHRALLLDVLRLNFGLTGSKRSCDGEVCGACTVLVEGRPVSSCSTLAIDCEGKAIHTIESSVNDTVMQTIQAAFIKHGALQCGFCIPGLVVTIRSLIDKNPNPTKEDVLHYLHGNICRCTGYQSIIDAVLDTAQVLRNV